MKFIADEGIDSTLVKMLRNEGFDVLYFAETDSGTDDEVILDLANRENRILITKDKDFGELVYRMKKLHAGIILVRLETMNSIKRSTIVYDFILNHVEILQYHFVVIQIGAIRFRKL
jgi:predicted nuclease of predicted toxin-antitoxin system